MRADEGKLAETFGAVLRDYRVRAGLTQEGLAHEAGLERTYISFLERGLRSPSLRVVFQLAKPLGLAPSKLIAALEKKLD